MSPELIAVIAHEANRAISNALGDFSQLPWAETSGMLKDSARAGVRSILSDPNKTPADLHRAWVTYKTDEGWVHGAVRDSVAKTHPNLVPFNELPVHDQMRDWVFRAIVLAAGELRIDDPRAIEADRAIQAVRVAEEAEQRAAQKQQAEAQAAERARLAGDAEAQRLADEARTAEALEQARIAEEASQAQAQANSRLVTSIEADAARQSLVESIARDSGEVSQGPDTSAIEAALAADRPTGLTAEEAEALTPPTP